MKNKYIYFWDGGCFALLCFGLATKPLILYPVSLHGAPGSLTLLHQKELAPSWKSSLYICSSDALWSRATEGSDWSPFALRPILPLPPPRCLGRLCHLFCPCFLVVSAGGMFQDRLAVEKQEALHIQHLQGSWLTSRPADLPRLRLALAEVFQSPYMLPPCSPRSSQKEGGAHPGEEPRPPSARRLGRPGPPPGAQRHPPESRFAPLWALGSGTGARRDWGPGAVLPRASGGRCRGARC